MFISFHIEVYSVVTALFFTAMLYGQMWKLGPKWRIYRPNSVFSPHISTSITSRMERKREHGAFSPARFVDHPFENLFT
jgi:hypothetical protein